jgi:hypothetical protein
VTANSTEACPSCGSEDLEMCDDDEWACLQCDHEWPGEVVRGEQAVNTDTMAVRDEDGTYTLYELWYVDDPDTAKVIKLRSRLSRTEAEKETPYVLDEPPESRLLG